MVDHTMLWMLGAWVLVVIVHAVQRHRFNRDFSWQKEALRRAHEELAAAQADPYRTPAPGAPCPHCGCRGQHP